MAINFNGVRIIGCAPSGGGSPSNNITTFETVTGDSSTKFLAHFDGSNGSTSFTDDSSSPLTSATFSGGAVISTTQSKFGGSSLYTNGVIGSTLKVTNTNNKISIGSNSFTLELWFRMNVVAPWRSFINFDMTTNGEGPSFYLTNTNVLAFGAPGFGIDSGIVPTVNTWHHVAAVGTVGQHIKLYVDGTLRATRAGAYNITQPSGGDITFGRQVQFPSGIVADDGNRTLNGYIDEVRFSNTARYSANFTPSASAFGTGIVTYPTAVLGKMAKDNIGFLYECTDASVPTWRRYTLG